MSTEAAPTGNPLVLGLSGFVMGAIALGLTWIGLVSPAAPGAPLPILLAGSALITVFATVWAMRLGQNAVAGIFGTFTAFWASYSLLVFGLVKGWLGVVPSDIAHTEAIFVISWLTLVSALTFATLRLPSSFTAVFVLVDVTLILQLIAILDTSATASKVSGFTTLAFAAIGTYLFVDTMQQAAGGKPLPIGSPLMKG